MVSGRVRTSLLKLLIIAELVLLSSESPKARRPCGKVRFVSSWQLTSPPKSVALGTRRSFLVFRSTFVTGPGLPHHCRARDRARRCPDGFGSENSRLPSHSRRNRVLERHPRDATRCSIRSIRRGDGGIVLLAIFLAMC